MESTLGRNNNLRSLVRPVSPLSRWQKSLLPEDDKLSQSSPPLPPPAQPVSRRINRQDRARSRSPLDFLSDKAEVWDVVPHVESRRIIVRRPMDGQGPTNGESEFPHVPTNNDNGNDNRRFGKQSWNRGYRQQQQQQQRHYVLKSKLQIPLKIERLQCCPILLRIFYSINAKHTPLINFKRGNMPENEIQINTWIDASLGELASELRHVCALARRRGSRLHFAIVYPDSRGLYGRRQLGVVITGYGKNSEDYISESVNNKSSDVHKRINMTDDSNVTLMCKRFQIGDYIDCAIVEYIPGKLVGWSTGRRPLGPINPQNMASNEEENLCRI